MSLPALFVFISILLGGSSRFGLWPNIVLELASIILLAAVAMTSREAGWLIKAPGLLVLMALVSLTLALNVVPLPPSIWSEFPGRSFVLDGYRLLGISAPALPFSLDPLRAKESALSLFPALCAAILLLRVGRPAYLPLAIATTSMAILSIILGIAQRIGGGEGLYPYSDEDIKVAVGLFANENHFATFLLMSIPFAAAAYADLRMRASGSGGRAHFFILAVLIGFLSVGVWITGSVAGVLLLLPALLFTGALLSSGKLKQKILPTVIGTAILLGASSALVLSSNNAPTLKTSFGSDALDRRGILRSSLEVAKTYWPAGAGLGSFEAVYKVHEDLETVSSVYVNHAHNDYVELVIELGLVGLILLLSAGVYWAKWSYRAWTGSGDRRWQQAASIAILLVALHSAIDYPARTLTILVLLSSCFAILRQPQVPEGGRSGEGSDGAGM